MVDYLGITADVQPAINAASSVVLPSYGEDAPRTLIEAAAMARLLITTDVPGCRAVVDRDVSGFLCAPRRVDSLAAAMKCFLMLPPDARRAMGAAGRAKVEREYDQAIVVEAYRNALPALVLPLR